MIIFFVYTGRKLFGCTKSVPGILDSFTHLCIGFFELIVKVFHEPEPSLLIMCMRNVMGNNSTL